MANFTVAIPDELLSQAKVVAARTDTSVNAIIRQLLEGYVRNESSPLSGNYEILFKYSLGQISEHNAMKELHLDDVETLALMTIQAGFPLPRLSLPETAAMQKNFGDMVDRFGHTA
ncbi:ribbon-helix-helix domain-containing protein [Thiomonas sp. FB-Cd]|uniref:ribbon-helix-helix domain-containing protein n=1 Tax=Thiomonas sp. FB-Cd TaxID=1158292 RepID=UPI0004DF794B|nr:ribbon-helix-helix domain-containing protein [Thiomonas sp. FB-Cd]